MSIKYHAATAFYGNPDKTVIIVQATENNGQRDADFERAIVVQPSPVFDEFVSQVSLEQVEENTVKLLEELKASEDERDRRLIDRMKKELGSNIIATDAPGAQAGFDPNSMEAEDLFKLKLQSFEIAEVKDSKNRTLKGRIRKADNFTEVIAFTAATILDTLNSAAEKKPAKK